MDAEEDSSSQSPLGFNQPSAGSAPRSASASHAPATPIQGGSKPPSGLSSKAPSSPGEAASCKLSKRSRGLGVITPNACTECRRKRAKCDGKKPCARCKAHKGAGCVYEVPVHQSKENLRTEIEGLRRHARSSEQIFAALTRPDLQEDILLSVRSGHSIEAISEWLDGAPTSGGAPLLTSSQHTEASIPVGSDVAPLLGMEGIRLENVAIMGIGPRTMGPVAAQQSSLWNELSQNSPWQSPSDSQEGLIRSSDSDLGAISCTANRHGSTQNCVTSRPESLQSDKIKQDMPELKEPERESPAIWTRITEDTDLVKHLLALYFCWEYPTFATFSKEQFLRDFQNGHRRYCSPILTNALLALGCRFSTQPVTRTNPSDPYSSGDHFFKESQRLLSQETDHHSLTTVQALGIMSIREASCGRDSEGWYYAGQSARLAIEMGLHRSNDEGDEDGVAVRSATFWGAFALDHAWSLATGSLPQFSQFPHLHPKPAIIDDIETSLWVPYTDDGTRLQRSWEQPSNVRSVYRCFCELSELVHQALYTLHSPTNPLKARDLLSLYTQYLTWYDQTPEALRLGHNFTPAVLFTHMYYHFAILLLFQPLVKLRIIGSEISPRDLCIQATVAIQRLLKSYSQLYTLRRTPSFVPYFVLTSSITQLTISAISTQPGLSDSTQTPVERAVKLDPQVSKAISQSLADLTEMASSHHSAKKALNILQYLVKEWRTEVDVDCGDPPPEDLERIVQFHRSGLNLFARSVQKADPLSSSESARGATLGPTNAQTSPSAEVNMENPLLRPFFMRGQPVMPSGEGLEQAGFTAL